jgi:hypothetical protein
MLLDSIRDLPLMLLEHCADATRQRAHARSSCNRGATAATAATAAWQRAHARTHPAELTHVEALPTPRFTTKKRLRLSFNIEPEATKSQHTTAYVNIEPDAS